MNDKFLIFDMLKKYVREKELYNFKKKYNINLYLIYYKSILLMLLFFIV